MPKYNRWIAKIPKRRENISLFNLIFKNKQLRSWKFLVLLAIIAAVFTGVFAFKGEESTGKGIFSNNSLYFSAASSQRDYPEYAVIQKNSLVGFSPSFLGGMEVMLTYVEEEEREEITEYQVEQGDTLSSIAEKFDISLNTILWANDLTEKSTIAPGKKLVILPVSGIMHLVNKGDTLGQISEDYKVELAEIMAFNDIPEEGDIYVGDILIIPGGKAPVAPKVYSVPLASSYFIFPCQGTISQQLHWYNAVDVANKCGTAVFAAAEGQVQKTGWTAVGGNYVRILHSNGVVTYYGHLSKILVTAGQNVSQGNMIGYMGETGYSATGCHLHFDVRGAKNPLSAYSLGTYLSWK